ncbi:MAG: hypothetical protein Q8S73_13080 [Deltaproteobacteria bacterium]|nr:hypothetical protein [Myxococcales bacterium]MDP3215034.1 hypothetical protein [Deltaproteobacteria bacterium]
MSQPTPSRPPAETASSKLFTRLFVELFQTEESALQHPRIEAERLGDAPPGRTMMAVSEHAGRSLEELRALASAEGLETTSAGARLGDLFSVLRDAVADRTLDREKSYRGTLLGMRHGIDLVTLVEGTARVEGRVAVSSWCQRWLAERRPLTEGVAGELAWFAANPEHALESAKDPIAAPG